MQEFTLDFKRTQISKQFINTFYQNKYWISKQLIPTVWKPQYNSHPILKVIDSCTCLSHLLDSNLYQYCSRIHQQCLNCKRGYNDVTSERGHHCYKLLATDTTQCFDFGNSLKSCLNGNEIIRSDDNGTISLEITPSYRNLNIRVLIGIENGFVDVICSIRNANFIAKYNNIYAAIKEAVNGSLKGILDYTDDEIILIDFDGNTHSLIFVIKVNISLNDDFFKLVA
ncbi:unnamed protein product [Rotaria sordida]|uniref:Glyceraldehyde 3-phosphate dehydrogenase catalytic domain-containing protein n=1 Tax=Rotaria sordida TaxID=392033 RepID=A0A814BAI7_9BILA|nr:unnamed protein product [Rotaria sordida]CAF1228724.1 unnamed protein product [Rotaria sordida]